MTGTRYMYHDPCHTPMKLQDPIKTVNALVRRDERSRSRRTTAAAASRARFAVTRPDIATQVRFRKEEEMRKGAAKLRADGFERRRQDPDQLPVLPAGPVALQRRLGHEADYIVVEIARHLLGENWLPNYVANANNGGIERVLV